MSNVRSITQEDLDRYPSLKGRQVGDIITAQEDFELRKQYAEKNGEAVPEQINPETGLTGLPTSIEGEESEAEESAATRRTAKSRK